MKMDAKKFLDTVGNLPDWMLTEDLLENRKHALGMVKELKHYILFQIIIMIVAPAALLALTHDIKLAFTFAGLVVLYTAGRWFLYKETQSPSIVLSKDSVGKFGLLIYFLGLSHRPALYHDMEKADYVAKCHDVLHTLSADVGKLKEDLRTAPEVFLGSKSRYEIVNNDLDEARERFNEHFTVMARLDLTNHLRSTFLTNSEAD